MNTPHDRERRPPPRTEPTLGDIDRLRPADDLPHIRIEPRMLRAPVAAPPRPRARRRAWWPLLLILLVLVAGSWVVFNPGPLRALFPSTELNILLTRGDRALAAGQLGGDGTQGAREDYEAARAMEPDNERALAGLNRVGHAELVRARSELAAHQLDAAEAALAQARELLGGGPDVDRLAIALRAARNAGVQIEALVGRAQQALADGHLEGSDGAAALYRRVLDADPGNAVGRHGLDQVGDALATQARAALDAGNIAQAATLLDRVAALRPADAALPDLRARLAAMQRDADTALRQHLAQGRADLRGGHFTTPAGSNALTEFQAALALDPNNAEARSGLGQVAEALIVQAHADTDAAQFARARQLLDQAAQLAPDSADLAAARARLAERQRQSANASAAPAALSAAQRAQVRTLLAQGAQAAAAGRLLSPPGDCAYDLYRSALAIDAQDSAALGGLAMLPARAQTLYAQDLRSGQLQQAGSMLDSFVQLAPADPAAAQMKRQLADAWLDRASQRLAQGLNADARAALDHARALAPDDPRVAVLDARLSAGSGG